MTPATQLLEKRRQVLDVDSGLKNQKEIFNVKMYDFQKRQKELEEREKQLEENVQKFDRFLKENESKQVRAQKKTLEEKKLKELKETEIGQLKECVDQFDKQRVRQCEAMKRCKFNKNFLKKF